MYSAGDNTPRAGFLRLPQRPTAKLARNGAGHRSAATHSVRQVTPALLRSVAAILKPSASHGARVGVSNLYRFDHRRPAMQGKFYVPNSDFQRDAADQPIEHLP